MWRARCVRKDTCFLALSRGTTLQGHRSPAAHVHQPRSFMNPLLFGFLQRPRYIGMIKSLAINDWTSSPAPPVPGGQAVGLKVPSLWSHSGLHQKPACILGRGGGRTQLIHITKDTSRAQAFRSSARNRKTKCVFLIILQKIIICILSYITRSQYEVLFHFILTITETNY